VGVVHRQKKDWYAGKAVSPSPAAVTIVKHAEGFRAEPYCCPAGKLTIGYGHTRGVTEGQRVTPEIAEALLREDLDAAARDLLPLVRAPLTQSQFDALASFAFNIGASRFAKSTLLRKLNAGDYDGAAAEFGRWVYARGKKLPGLVARRHEEAKLFRS
jgi:lysozyme